MQPAQLTINAGCIATQNAGYFRHLLAWHSFKGLIVN